MNYIWHPLLKAIEFQFDISKIHYRVKNSEFYYNTNEKSIFYNLENHKISPLFEYIPSVFQNISNLGELDYSLLCVDINPFNRFSKIFEKLLNYNINNENILIISDVFLHILAYLDQICGLSKYDIKILILIKEIEDGFLGDIKKEFDIFNKIEKYSIAEMLIMLYKTESFLNSIIALFDRIIPSFNILLLDTGSVLFYSPYKYNYLNYKKLMFIIYLFLPINLNYEIHWEYSYGIIGYDQSLILEKFVV